MAVTGSGTRLTEHVGFGERPDDGDFVTKNLGGWPSDPVGIGIDTATMKEN